MKLSDIERDTLKRAVLDSGLDKEYNKARKKAFYGDTSDLDKLLANYPYEVILVARNLTSAEFRKYRRVFHRMSRYIVAGECVFLTLTFNDEALLLDEKTRRVYVSRLLRELSLDYVANIDYGKTTEREHYHALYRFVGFEIKNKFVPSLDCCGNQLFKEDGKPLLHKEAFYLKDGRWLPVSSLPVFARWRKLYGFVSCQVVASSEKSAKISSKYVGKSLTSHALKKSTKREGMLKAPRLIYSRIRR